MLILDLANKRHVYCVYNTQRTKHAKVKDATLRIYLCQSNYILDRLLFKIILLTLTWQQVVSNFLVCSLFTYFTPTSCNFDAFSTHCWDCRNNLLLNNQKKKYEANINIYIIHFVVHSEDNLQVYCNDKKDHISLNTLQMRQRIHLSCNLMR